MSRFVLLVLCVCGAVVWPAANDAALAQWAPAGSYCQCVQPVYRTVPVTEYQPVKRIVQRPVVETKWVDRQVTEYRPVTETRTATVPTVSYETVTEYQTVQRNAGYWTTRYYVNYKLSPAQYDPRPTLAGWLNRTSYTIRQAFTPNVIPRREYVPQIVTQVVPVTRMVARHGTRKVTYNVTRLVPYTTTRKVAINTVRMVAEEVTSMRPVTVMRSVPIGTAMSFAPYGGSATALAPTPDPIGTAEAPSQDRTAERPGTVEGYRREKSGSRGIPSEGASLVIPKKRTVAPVPPQARNGDGRYDGYRPIDDSRSTTNYPSVIRIGRRGWTPRKTTGGPELKKPTVSLADGR